MNHFIYIIADNYKNLSLSLLLNIFLFIIILQCLSMGESKSFAQEPGSSEFFLETTSLPETRQFHGAAVLGNFLYVFGGETPQGASSSVLMARIHSDGTLGEWVDTTPLPSSRMYIANSTLVLNDMVYIIGGLENSEGGKYNTAIWSRPQPDGTLESWQESPPFGTEGLSNLTAVSTPGFIHILGGLTRSQAATNSVVSGAIGTGGALTRWEPGPPLPVPLWFHNAAAMGGRVWVWSGLFSVDSSQGSADVHSAPILSTGRLGVWRQEYNSLPMPLYSAAQSSAGNYIISFCPRLVPDAKETGDVWFANVTPQGLSQWGKLGISLPLKVYIAAATDYRHGFVYIPGGRQKVGGPQFLDTRVFYFKLAPEAQASKEADNIAEVAMPGLDHAMKDSSSLTYLSQSHLALGAVPGFRSYDQARAIINSGQAIPCVMYFHSNKGRKCINQAKILRSQEFLPLSSRTPFVWLEVSDWPQLAHQLGIFRTPTWIFYDSNQREKARITKVLSLSELDHYISTLR